MEGFNYTPTSVEVLWEGDSENFAKALTGGKAVGASYQLTADALHFSAGYLSTKAEAIPLIHVVDLDLSQTMTQKARGVGDLVVKFDPSVGYLYGQRTVRLLSIRHPADVRQKVASQANAVRRAIRQHQHQQTIEQNRASAHTTNIANIPQPQAQPLPPPPSVPHLPPPPQQGMEPRPSIADELERLAALRDSGVLTEDEFQAQKKRILDT